MKPLIIYISGAPGSGKTTLAALIAERLYIPHISSDLVHGGIAMTDVQHDREHSLKHVFVPLLIKMSSLGISFVADHVLQKGLSEKDIIEQLQLHAVIINLHTICRDPIERYTRRIETSQVPNIQQRREQLLDRASVHRDNLIRTALPPDLDVPQLEIDTNDGYEPSFEEIINFIHQHYSGQQ